MLIGDRIKQLREERNLSQRALARLSEISQPTISAIENSTKSPSTITIMAIANALNVSLSDIVDAEEYKGAALEFNALRDEAMTIYDSLSEQKKDQALSYLRFLASESGKE